MGKKSKVQVTGKLEPGLLSYYRGVDKQLSEGFPDDEQKGTNCLRFFKFCVLP